MLVAGDGMPPAAEDNFRETSVLHVAEAALRRSGDLERLEALCREVLDDQRDNGGDLFAEAWRCVGDALVLQGHHEDAVAAFEELAAERDPFIPAPVLLRWGAARLALTRVTRRAGRSSSRRRCTEARTEPRLWRGSGSTTSTRAGAGGACTSISPLRS